MRRKISGHEKAFSAVMSECVCCRESYPPEKKAGKLNHFSELVLIGVRCKGSDVHDLWAVKRTLFKASACP